MRLLVVNSRFQEDASTSKGGFQIFDSIAQVGWSKYYLVPQTWASINMSLQVGKPVKAIESFV